MPLKLKKSICVDGRLREFVVGTTCNILLPGDPELYSAAPDHTLTTTDLFEITNYHN